MKVSELQESRGPSAGATTRRDSPRAEWPFLGSALAGFSLALLLGALGCQATGARTVAHRAALPRAVVASERDEVLALRRLVDRHRSRIGRAPLIWDDRLAEVARKHSRDMARRGFFSHVNPDGIDPFERLSAAGIPYRAAAENIAEGQTSGREVLEDWLESPGHRRNLDDAAYTHHGIGRYGNHWTHVFVGHGSQRRSRGS
jgi:uncharacterized protein YkwD